MTRERLNDGATSRLNEGTTARRDDFRKGRRYECTKGRLNEGTTEGRNEGTTSRLHDFTKKTTSRPHDFRMIKETIMRNQQLLINLKVYQLAYASALEIHQLTKSFPVEEKFSLTDQIRRSSRSICANIAEAIRKRRYPKNFISKLSDSEAEANETEVWLDSQNHSITLIK